jgi:hypothetical protein
MARNRDIFTFTLLFTVVIKGSVQFWIHYSYQEVYDLGDGGGMNLIDLAEDRDHWSAVVNTVMNLWIP